MWAPTIGTRFTPKATEPHAITVDVVDELLRTDVFRDWFRRFQATRLLLERTEGMVSDPVCELVLRIGDEEDQADQAEADHTRADASFELLADYEACDEKVAAAWIEQSQVENEVENIRDRIDEITSRLRAVKRLPVGPVNKGYWERLNRELEEYGPQLTRLEAELDVRRKQHMKLVWKKEAMWRDVAETWEIAFRARIAQAEHEYRATRLRRALKACERKPSLAIASGVDPNAPQRAALHRAELEVLTLDAERRFGCVLIGEFMYWPVAGDPQAALCVPLIAEHDLLNLQVEPLTVYRVSRKRGLGFIEPVASQSSPQDDDYRLDAFFLFGRPAMQRRPKTIRVA